MAINIYLVLFKNWSTRQLRSLDQMYLIATYGISLIPAVVFIFVNTRSRGKVYGPAVVSSHLLAIVIDSGLPTNNNIALVLDIWTMGISSHRRPLWFHVVCRPENKPWKIFLHTYIFSRIAVIIAIIIYIMAGIQVYKKREALSGFLNPFNESPFTAVMTTTEVTVTSEDIEQHRQQRNKSESELQVQEVGRGQEGYDPYSVNIEIGRPEPAQRPRRPSRPAVFRLPAMTRRIALSEDNAEAFLYARVAFLFFVALLITWVPSSINRAYSLAHPDDLNFGLNFSSALVFAIQGLLNCLVYMMTSQTAVRNLWRKMWGRAPIQNLKYDNVERIARKGGGKREGRQTLDSDTTSTTNLTVH